MGLFGDKEAKADFEKIKDDYRNAKRKIADTLYVINQINDQTHRSAQSTKFQYLVKENLEQEILDNLGFDGWSLVSCTSYATGFGVNGNSSMKVTLSYVFKRPIVSTPDIESALQRLDDLKEEKLALAESIERRGYKAE